MDTKSKILVKENFEAKRIDADAVDLMTAAALGKNGSAPEVVALAFDHQLSKVTIAVQAQQGVSATITDVRLYGLSETGTFECGISDTGAGFQWEQQQMGEATTEDNTSYRKSRAVAVSDGGREDLMTVLAIPQGITNATLLVTYHRKGEGEQTARLALNTNFTEWKAGQAYSYTLSIAVDAITFSGITADGWDIRSSGGDINIGESTSN